MRDQGPDVETALQMRRLFPARRDRVFRAWTEPAEIVKWFRPMGAQTTVVQLELRVGGSYQFNLLLADGSVGSIVGKFLEINRPEKLVFTWSSGGTNEVETLVTLEFVERGDSTEISLRHERFPDAAMAPLHQQGWASAFDSLAISL